MRFTCILHPACKKQHVWCNKNANLCNFDCNLIQLHVILHYIPHYMKKCITWKLHDNYMIYYMYYKHFTSVSLFSHLKKGITWKLHDNYTIYYMYYQHFTSASFFSHVVKNLFFVICGQPTCSMSTLIFVQGHQPGLLLVLYQLWDLNQSGMSAGVIQRLWGILSWWWNGNSHPQETARSKQCGAWEPAGSDWSTPHAEACPASLAQAASPSTLPCPSVASPSPPASSQQDSVRRLSLGGYTSTIDELDSVPASSSPSPAVVCSLYRLQ